MNMQRLRILLCACWLSLVAFHVDADTDAMQLRLLEAQQLPLRWDNVENSPAWVYGVAPFYKREWKMHVITLTPGKRATFYLPPRRHLRLYSPEQTLQADSIEAFVSDGSGLEALQSMQPSSDGHSLVLTSRSDMPQWVHITRAATQPDALTVGVFVSRLETLPALAPYRELLPIAAEKVWLTAEVFQLPELFWQLQAGQRYRFDVEGPTRLAFKTRLRYEPEAAELLQDYRLGVQIDANAWQWLPARTGAESLQVVAADARIVVVGREQLQYLEIPAGKHTIALQADRVLYAQVLQQKADDYLLSEFNQPRLPVTEVRRRGLLQPPPELNLAEAKAKQAAKDNRFREGGLLGSDLLTQAALKRQDYPHGLQEAEKLYSDNTFYRDLVPGKKVGPAQQTIGYFLDRELLPNKLVEQDVVLAAQHQEAALQRLNSGFFTQLSGRGEVEANHYYLPELAAPSKLRIIVDKQKCSERHFWVQYDRQAPVKWQLHCQENAQLVALRRSLAEAALLLSRQQPDSSANVTLERAFSAYDDPGRLVDAAMQEMPLPASVRLVNIWQDQADAPPLKLALQYRASKPFTLSEQSFLSRLQTVPSERAWQMFKQDLQGIADGKTPDEAELRNEWQAEVRFIVSEYRQYRASVAARMPQLQRAQAEMSLADIKRQAQSAEQRKDWTAALEAWKKLAYFGAGQDRDRAQLAQADILAQLGEDYLSEELWRYVSLYAERSIAEQAIERLMRTYRAQNDLNGMQMLAAAMLAQWPSEQNMRQLIAVLMENEQYRYALLLGLAFLPQPPHEQMLTAAYRLQWWQTYRRLVAQLPKQQQRFWTGLEAQYRGDFATAQEHWNVAEWQPWQVQLQRGLEIKRNLKPGSDEQILAGYRNWQDWSQQQPGPRVWHDASQWITDYAGGDTYYNAERDLTDSAYRATADRPLALSLVGPVKLNFQMRVLHPGNQNEAALDGWIEIADNDDRQGFPYTNNMPTQDLQVTGDGSYRLGRMVNMEYQVGEGRHEIKLFSKQALLSVKVQEQRPLFPLTVLPPLTPDTFNAVLAAPDVQQRAENPDVDMQYTLLIDPAKGDEFLLNSRERILPSRTPQQDVPLERLPVTASRSLTVPLDAAASADLLRLPKPGDLETAQLRMMQYLLQLETQRSADKALLFQAEQLLAAYPGDALLQSLWRRLSRNTEWQAVGSVVSPAGMRLVDTAAWQPEGLMLQVRKALLAPLRDDEHVLFDDAMLVYQMSNPTATALQTSARLFDVPFLPEQDAVLHYQVDDGAIQQLLLAREGAERTLKLTVPAGEHEIRFLLPRPISNQFIALRFNDSGSPGQIREERPYFLSTRNQPLQVYAQGPALLRIDEWTDGHSVSRYQEVAPGWQKITLAPQYGKPESLLRIKQRAFIAEMQPIPNRFPEREIISVPVADIALPPTANARQVRIDDQYQLGRQEDGTLSMGFDLQRRLIIEPQNVTSPEEFGQYRLEHRYFDEPHGSYWLTRALARARVHGGPTFGLSESLFMVPEPWPFRVYLNTKGLVQEVDGNPEWLGHVNIDVSKVLRLTPKTYIIPRLSPFMRHLSLKGDPRVNDKNFQRQIDQDVYTSFKADHTQGLGGGLTIQHNPWLDTLWFASFGAGSNEDFNLINPDHMILEAEWRQMLGDFQLNAGYHAVFYQKDNDRPSSVTRSQVQLDLRWLNWSVAQHRLELDAQYIYDIERNAHLPMLSLTVYFGEGRGYRDFNPGDVDFLELRKQRIPNEQNNRLEESFY